MSSPIFIHVLSLNIIGGVEALYIHYIKEALTQGKSVHYTSVSGKKPHEQFDSVLKDLSHKPFLEQYVAGVRLPRWLQFIVNIRRGMIEDLVKPTAWVFWNRIEEKVPSGHSVYYEHGASWSLFPTKKRKEFLRHCSSFIANSEAASIMLQKRWDIKAPITVIPNPLRPDITIASSPRTLNCAKPLRLGFIGRLVPVKGAFIALHVVKSLVDKKIPVTLFIAGVGMQEESLRVAAKKLGIASHVIFSGCVSDVTAWLDSIDILIVPSIREPLGLVSLEAAARGIPVIASAVDGLPEVVSDGQTGFLLQPKILLKHAGPLLSETEGLPEVVVDPIKKDLEEAKLIDPCDCTEAILKLLQNSSLYTQLSENALQKASSRPLFSAYYESLNSILEKEIEVVE